MENTSLQRNGWVYSARTGIATVVLCLAILTFKEFSTPLGDSSRGLVVDMFFDNSWAVNYPIFGNVVALGFSLFNGLFSIMGHLSPAAIIYAFSHLLFLSSGALIVLFYYRLRDDVAFPAWVPILLLFVNPAFLSLDTFAWRQCLSLAVFVWGVSLTKSRVPWAGWCLQIAAVLVHPGNAPIVALYWVVTVLDARARLILVTSLIVVGMPALYLGYPVNPSFVPDWFPFRRILIMEQTFADSNFEFNNISGDLVFKYMIFAVPALFISARHLFLKCDIPQYIEDILIATILPISVMNFLPGANRMLVGIFMIVALFGAHYIVYLLRGRAVVPQLAQRAALLGILVFHAGMYLAL